MKKILKIIFKILGIILAIAFVFLVVQFYRFSRPKTDLQIVSDFAKVNQEAYLTLNQFKDQEYRVLSSQKEIDTSKTTLVFVHGSIGSAMDFKKYLQNDDLLKEFNMIAYDRIGYGEKQTGMVMESIEFEAALLKDLIKGIPSSKISIIGYSYGGPIALALKEHYHSIVLLAPAVYSEVEPMPWALNFYKWKLTRWVLPEVWRAASKEKLSHREDLKKFQDKWEENSSPIVSIHGDKDWIVPDENSNFLKGKFSLEQFEWVTLSGAGHGLVWSHFDEIKEIIIRQLKD